jgi:acid phosphatase (class A)
MKRIALLSLMLLIGQPALADGNPNHADIELSNLLPPPPAAGSTAASEDLRAVLAAQ